MDPYGDSWSNVPEFLEHLQEWMRVYYAMTSNLDWNVGRLMKSLKEMGLEKDTIVVFSSDHGEMFGSHGRMKKNIFYDEATRIPMIFRCPERFAPKKLAACLSNVDIMPTLLGLAGCEIPDEVEGLDLSHLIRGEHGEEPEFALLQNTGACACWENGHEWRALRTQRYTYAKYRGCEDSSLPEKELLFDNLKDPYQTKNLINDPSCLEVAKDFREKLQRKMSEINDQFPESTWYRDKWISKNRLILKTATLN